MEITKSNWPMITDLVGTAMKSSFCCGMGTVDPDGLPNVTPIGSLVFKDVGKAFYFEENPVNAPKNIRENSAVCFMAVNSSKMFWLKFFITGTLSTLTGIRLYGRAGEKRRATDEEQHIWKEYVKSYKKFKGYEVMWKDLSHGREVTFHSFEPVQCGKPTEGAVLKLCET